MNIRFIQSIDDVSAQQWNRLRHSDYPFLAHEFLLALEKSESVCADSGWQPTHLLIEEDEQLIAALPLYLKSHSYGEYVFDWQWANAFQQHGRRYYPKLLSAVPFTPSTGPRFLCWDTNQFEALLHLALKAIAKWAEQHKLSSWHLLFPDSELAGKFDSDTRFARREDTQFHWRNRHDGEDSQQPYNDFDEFLAGFRSAKRKQIRRERRKIAEQQLMLSRKVGTEISQADWQAFYVCYQDTYLKRSGHSGYLSKAFFDQLAAHFSEQCMMVTARLDANVVASSLFFFDEHTLYGRYWGALGDFDCLHFEACYYQGIDFAIERRLRRFDPGTQGEHKLVRGFEPYKTCSYHWIADPEFDRAIQAYVARERQYQARYKEAAAQHLPFHRDNSSPNT